METMETKIISVISGKGGTGKSLFTAVLGSCLAKEHCKVLIVDMDIHVRGLTLLLSDYISIGKEMSVTDCLEREDYDDDFAIYRFQECEILPAVIDMGYPLKKGIKSEAIDTFMTKLYDFVQEKKYAIVLLDCRSGLDESLVKIVKFSDYVISVSEDDDVCLKANSNLIEHLRHEEGVKYIYSIVNKGRRINNKDDLKDKLEKIYQVNCIGVIPFDKTIMEDYGKDRFWLTVYDTLYFYGIVRFWNDFQKITSIKYSISENVYSFGDEKNRISIKINNIYMVFRFYGFIALIIGIIMPIVLEFGKIDISSIDVKFSMLSIMGLFMLVLSSEKFKRFLLGKDDDPKKK